MIRETTGTLRRDTGTRRLEIAGLEIAAMYVSSVDRYVTYQTTCVCTMLIC